MKLGPSRRSPFVPALVAALVLLGVSIALAGLPRQGRPPAPGPVRTTVSPSPSEVAGGHPSPSPSASDGPIRPGGAVRVTAGPCERALRHGEAVLEIGEGISTAIRRVAENCRKNPRAAGLLRALERLERDQEPRGRGGQAHGRNVPRGGDRGRHVGPHEPEAPPSARAVRPDDMRGGRGRPLTEG
jgi:hypothetical protein